MRWVLPGGAELGARDREADERAVACRPGFAVLESVRPLTILKRLRAALKGVRDRLVRFRRWLFSARGKRVLEVLVLVIGLISAILALFGWPQR